MFDCQFILNFHSSFVPSSILSIHPSNRLASTHLIICARLFMYIHLPARPYVCLSTPPLSIFQMRLSIRNLNVHHCILHNCKFAFSQSVCLCPEYQCARTSVNNTSAYSLGIHETQAFNVSSQRLQNVTSSINFVMWVLACHSCTLMHVSYSRRTH